METRLLPEYRVLPEAGEMEAVLRRCVHCGFCTATCPTYRLLGDENDGPRGRIYLIKQFLEGGACGPDTLRHLDRCLTCRSCETTCPSGVEYHRLLARARPLIARKQPRPLLERGLRFAIAWLIPYPERYAALLDLGEHFDFLLPGALRRRLPRRRPRPPALPEPAEADVLVLSGCAQQVTHPGTNQALQSLLARQGIRAHELREPACCGALHAHLDCESEAIGTMRRMIEAWETACNAQGRTLEVTAAASGCGLHLREYGEHFLHDPEWRHRAQAFADAVRDPGELLSAETVQGLARYSRLRRIVFHAPCTLQHGLRLDRKVRGLLTAAGFELLPVREPWRCCGSAGAWSLLHPGYAQRLLEQRLAGFPLSGADAIVTANLGCQMQLASGTEIPVLHWLELLGEAMDRRSQSPAGGREAR